MLDLAETARTLEDAVGWIARACGARVTTAARLRIALAARRRARRRAELVSAIADVDAGCHSLLELRYLREVERRHGLPAGSRQQQRRRPGGSSYHDVWYEEYRTIVELDGRAAHPEHARWRDMHRDNAAAADGLSVLRYGTGAVTEATCRVAAQVATVLLGNGWPGPPRPCRPGCPAGDARSPRPGSR